MLNFDFRLTNWQLYWSIIYFSLFTYCWLTDIPIAQSDLCKHILAWTQNFECPKWWELFQRRANYRIKRHFNNIKSLAIDLVVSSVSLREASCKSSSWFEHRFWNYFLFSSRVWRSLFFLSLKYEYGFFRDYLFDNLLSLTVIQWLLSTGF